MITITLAHITYFDPRIITRDKRKRGNERRRKTKQTNINKVVLVTKGDKYKQSGIGGQYIIRYKQ